MSMQSYVVGVAGLAIAGTVHSAPASFTKIASSESGLSATFEAPAAPNGPMDMTGGASVGDFDGNGYQDVFVVSDAVNPDRLYLNNGDGTFTDATAAWGLREVHHGINAAVGDYDGDGDVDVYVTSFGPAGAMAPGHHKLYTNNGSAFVDMASEAGVRFTSANHADGWGSAFGDIDLDGDLDLFVAGRMVDLHRDGDTMFRNNGDGTFSDVTEELFGTFFTDDRTYSFSPRLVDMNNDRRPELLLTSDYQVSRYFEQLPDGTFVNIAPGNGTALDSNGMGNTVADFNGDGRLDWYVTSIFWEVERTPPENNGNMFYIAGGGEHQYTSEGAHRNCTDGGWGWGVVANDYNHDGLMDLAETNGWRNSAEHVNEPAQLLLCQPEHVFENVSATSGFDHDGDGRALVAFDYDNDADMDLLIVGLGEELHLYRNDVSGDDANSLRLLFDTSLVPELAPDGFGVSLVTYADGLGPMLRQLDGGSSYNGQSELAVHVGLGSATVAEAVIITWSNGDTTRLADVDANQSKTVVAGGGPSDFNGDGATNADDIAALLAKWGEPHQAIDMDGSGSVDSNDLAILLAGWYKP